MNKNLMIIAGEASGDLHGSALVSNLLKLQPDLNIYGIGGDNMISAGMNTQFHIKQMAFLGFVEVIKHLPFIKKVLSVLLNTVKEKNISTVVLIDYPGFNLNIAKKLKRLGVKIIYYISPQIWAWHQSRVKKIERLVDKMLVILPFEKDFYKNANVDVQYVGHPLIERINEYKYLSREQLFNKLKLDSEKELLLLMPGSRMHEINVLFPTMIKAAETIAQKFNLNIVVACSQNIDEQIFTKISDVQSFKVSKQNVYDLFKYSKFGIIKSGTSTLEAGLFQLPIVVVYSTNAITYMLGKMLVKIKNIALLNIVAGKTLVEELIQNKVTVENIVNSATSVLSNEQKYKNIANELTVIKEKLDGENTSEKVAKIVLETMSNE